MLYWAMCVVTSSEEEDSLKRCFVAHNSNILRYGKRDVSYLGWPWRPNILAIHCKKMLALFPAPNIILRQGEFD